MGPSDVGVGVDVCDLWEWVWDLPMWVWVWMCVRARARAGACELAQTPCLSPAPQRRRVGEDAAPVKERKKGWEGGGVEAGKGGAREKLVVRAPVRACARACGRVRSL